MFKLAKKKEMVGFIEWDKRENDSITLSFMHVKYTGGGCYWRKGGNTKMGNGKGKCNTKILGPHNVRWQLPIGDHLASA